IRIYFSSFLYFNMKRKKGDNPPPPKVERNKGKAVDRGFPSLFAQTQTNLFN
ncbi:hypothetical protein AB4K20DRAFT_1908131, partial [Rhizopus microsporus]